MQFCAPMVGPCKLELNTKNFINEVAAKVPAKWRIIGLQLDLLESELDNIESETAGKPNRNMLAFQQVLEKWKALKRTPYAWSVIIESLKSPAVEEHHIADEIRTKCHSA